jgi:hypothetical protein
VPDNAGTAWIHCLRFADLDARGRWVGVRMYTGGLTATDELYVLGSAASDAGQGPVSAEPADFTVAHSQPHFHKPELIGNEVREDRRRLAQSDVLPWLTPGDAGTFPGESFQWALLECYANGARGIYFWSGRVWDGESLIAYNRVIRAIAPVEELIVEGELAGDAVSVDPPGRISGIRRGKEMLLLVGDYFRRSNGTLDVQLSAPTDSRLRDLLTGQILAAQVPRGKSTVRIDLAGARARLLHLQPSGG